MEYLEYFAVISSLIGVYLSIKQHILTWFWYIIAAILYGIIFYDAGLYADMELQIFFILSSIFGWVKWQKLEEEWKPEMTKGSYLFFGIVISLILAYGLAEIHLNFFENVSLAYFDAALAMLSVFGTILEAKKKIESWLFWIIINISYSGVYFYKDLIPSSALYLIFVGLSLKGLFEWRKKI